MDVSSSGDNLHHTTEKKLKGFTDTKIILYYFETRQLIYSCCDSFKLKNPQKLSFTITKLNLIEAAYFE